MTRRVGIGAGLLLALGLLAGCPSEKRDCSADADCPDGAYCRESDGICVGCPIGRQHPENDACVDDSVSACGPAGKPCPEPPAHGTATCSEGQCGSHCNNGWSQCEAGCCVVPSDCTGDGECAGDGTSCNVNWGICVVADCAGQPDFTPCEVASPKYSYNICVDGVCVEPGNCGDATCNVPGPHFTLADTNQTKCYNDSEEMSCPDLANPIPAFYGQDAQYGWDKTHDPSQARFTPVTLNNDLVVDDNVTKLEWQGCVQGLNDTCKDNRKVCTGDQGKCAWSQALDYCDGLEWGKLYDWRLPDPYELLSIVDASRASPSIDIAAFPEMISEMISLADGNFWSSSYFGRPASAAWFVNFGYGRVANNPYSSTLYVRCVRGGPAQQTLRYTKTITNSEPVVTDNVTKLVWQGCVVGRTGGSCETTVKVDVCTGGTDQTDEKCKWQEALAYCEALDWGGLTGGWRLPNMKELQSLVDSRHNTSISSTLFPATPKIYIWSSSSYVGSPDHAWYVDFGLGAVGFVNAYAKNNSTFSVRCVRDGP